MVLVEYDKRILVDNSFFEWLQSYKDKQKVMIFLSRIKSSSLIYKKTHNIFFKEDLPNNADRTRMIKTACSTITCPEFLNTCKDSITRNIKYAIYLTNDVPYNTAILSSDDHKTKYSAHTDFKNIKGVEIFAEDDAIRLITIMHNTYQQKRKLNFFN